MLFAGAPQFPKAPAGYGVTAPSAPSHKAKLFKLKARYVINLRWPVPITLFKRSELA
jgi:hypothetical protein